MPHTIRPDELSARRNMRYNGYNPYDTASEYLIARCRSQLFYTMQDSRKERENRAAVMARLNAW
jgi:hypothetical protein